MAISMHFWRPARSRRNWFWTLPDFLDRSKARQLLSLCRLPYVPSPIPRNRSKFRIDNSVIKLGGSSSVSHLQCNRTFLDTDPVLFFVNTDKCLESFSRTTISAMCSRNGINFGSETFSGVAHTNNWRHLVLCRRLCTNLTISGMV